MTALRLRHVEAVMYALACLIAGGVVGNKIGDWTGSRPDWAIFYPSQGEQQLCAVTFYDASSTVVGVAIRPSHPPNGGPNIAFLPPRGQRYDQAISADFNCAGWLLHEGAP